jgi:hypothetical protein
MTIDKCWSLLPSLTGGVTLTAVQAMRVRRKVRHEEKRRQKTQVQAWEGEGGNLSLSAIVSKAS